jgi:hypothetical protein
VQHLLARARGRLEGAPDGRGELHVLRAGRQEGVALEVSPDQRLPEEGGRVLELVHPHGRLLGDLLHVQGLHVPHHPALHHGRAAALDHGPVGPLGVGVARERLELVVQSEELVVERVRQLVREDDARDTALEALHQVEGLAAGVVEAADLGLDQVDGLLQVVEVRRHQAEQLGGLLVGREVRGALGGVDALLHVGPELRRVGDRDLDRGGEALAAQLLDVGLDLLGLALELLLRRGPLGRLLGILVLGRPGRRALGPPVRRRLPGPGREQDRVALRGGRGLPAAGTREEEQQEE